jgi:hypothetical protein
VGKLRGFISSLHLDDSSGCATDLAILFRVATPLAGGCSGLEKLWFIHDALSSWGGLNSCAYVGLGSRFGGGDLGLGSHEALIDSLVGDGISYPGVQNSLLDSVVIYVEIQP